MLDILMEKEITAKKIIEIIELRANPKRIILVISAMNVYLNSSIVIKLNFVNESKIKKDAIY
jgi:hypothetical protein